MVSEKKENVSADNAKLGFNPTSFVKETKEELSKVVWPSRRQLLGESFTVIIMVALSAALVYLADQFFGWVALKIF